MKYRFALTRGQLVLLLLCLVLGGIVAFVGGMLTGAWRYQARAAAAEAGTPAAGAAGPAATMGAGPPAVAGAPAGQGAAPSERIYEVQLAARLTREEAEEDIETLAAAGYQTYLWESRDAKGNSIFTVRMGPWPAVYDAAAAAQAFREQSGRSENEEIQRLNPVIRHRLKPAEIGPAAPVAASEPPG